MFVPCAVALESPKPNLDVPVEQEKKRRHVW